MARTGIPGSWCPLIACGWLDWCPPDSMGCKLYGPALQVEMDDGSSAGFRHVARSVERQCTVQGLRSGILYK